MKQTQKSWDIIPFYHIPEDKRKKIIRSRISKKTQQKKKKKEKKNPKNYHQRVIPNNENPEPPNIKILTLFSNRI